MSQGTINLNGHTIAVRQGGPCLFGPPDRLCLLEVGVFDSPGNVVKNGTFIGADVRGLATMSDLTVIGGDISLGGAHQVKRTNVWGGNIILLEGPESVRQSSVTWGSIIVDQRAPGSGVFEVTDSTVRSSPGDGIEVRVAGGESFTLARNTVLNSRGAGIRVGGLLQTVGAFRLADNVVTANRGSGVDVNGTLDPSATTIGGPGRIARTTASLNRGHGIDARWVPGVPTGIVDGGGNRASRNTTPPQCLGVTC